MPPVTRSRRSMSGHDLSPLEDAETGRKSRRQRPAEEEPLSLAGDKGALLLLLLLYTLQGVPMGLAATVTALLQERGASYEQQGVFSFVSWPFSLKILWAPLVDSLFFRSVGQRRSWLIPVQVRRRRRRARAHCRPRLTPLRRRWWGCCSCCWAHTCSVCWTAEAPEGRRMCLRSPRSSSCSTC